MTTSNRVPLFVMIGLALALVAGGVAVGGGTFRRETAAVNEYLKRLSRENLPLARSYHCIDVEEHPELDDGGYPQLRAVRRWRILRSELVEQQIPEIGTISSFNVFTRVTYSNAENIPIVGHLVFSVFETDDYAAILQSQTESELVFSPRSHCIDSITQ